MHDKQTSSSEQAEEPQVKAEASGKPAAPARLGFLSGGVRVPDDFNTMGQAESEALFGGRMEDQAAEL